MRSHHHWSQSVRVLSILYLLSLFSSQSCQFRSLVTTLRAAEKFDQSHLSSPAVAPLIDAAQAFYVEGYFLTHGVESVVEVARKASSSGKVNPFIIDLPFIPTLCLRRWLTGLCIELIRPVPCQVLWSPTPASLALL
jgi:hypothetical protein